MTYTRKFLLCYTISLQNDEQEVIYIIFTISTARFIKIIHDKFRQNLYLH